MAKWVSAYINMYKWNYKLIQYKIIAPNEYIKIGKMIR